VTAPPLPIDIRDPHAKDLIERIAAALPEPVRADYYREMAHCRVLPETDEMLRILRAMQFLALLIEQAPGEVAVEREKLAGILQEGVEAVTSTHRSAMDYLKKLEDRIVRMPIDVCEGLQPQLVAELISQDLRMRFADIPQSMEMLTGVSRQIGDTSAEFHKTAAQLTNSYTGLAENARVAIDQLQTSIGQAAAAARGAVRDLNQRFSKIQNTTVVVLCVGALSIGLGVGIVLDELIRRSAPAAPAAAASVAAPATQTAPAASVPPSGK